MRNFTKVLFLWALAITGYSQENFNLEIVANVPITEAGNDVWGYVDSTGTEYAIMANTTTTTIWSLEDPSNPIERASIPGPAGVWRDIKAFEDHLYVTSDQGAEGLLIIDMSGAPEVITSDYWRPTLTVGGIDDQLDRCHNLYIDTDQGFCYLSGCNISNRGILILDLNVDKKEPVHVGTADLAYSHDVYVKNDKMYTSEINIGMFNVYDVSDKTNPILLNGENTSRNFTHNAWLSDDENYLFTTDERGDSWVDAYDISDLEDIKLLDRYRPLVTENQGVVPHNTHYLNGYLITSWYTDGVVINDVTKPDNIIKVGGYDTSSAPNGGTNGNWGAYPYLPSGLVLASDRDNGLFVLQPVDNNGNLGYQRASYLEGIATDINTGEPISNVSVSILSTDPNRESSNIMGEYKTGQVTEGTFMVEYTHPNYDPETIMVTLTSGMVTNQDVQLGNAIMRGTVVDVDGQPIPNAEIAIETSDSDARILATADEDGNWEAGVRTSQTYLVMAAKWGFRGNVVEAAFDPNSDVIIQLEEGYSDDFFADLGWSTEINATSGAWELGRPNTILAIGTTTQTGDDIPTDIGSTYYVTGLSGTTGGENDIDGGNVVLTSPMMDFPTENNMADLSYHVWFANGGGNTDPNDRMSVSLTNGTETLELTQIDISSSVWSELIEITVSSDEIAFTDQMQVIVFATDDNPGHIVEVGFDVFNAESYLFTSTTDLEIENIGMTLFPNPADSYINVNVRKLWDGNKTMLITDNTGKAVMTKKISNTESTFRVEQLTSGIYNIQVIGDNKQSETLRLVKK